MLLIEHVNNLVIRIAAVSCPLMCIRLNSNSLHRTEMITLIHRRGTTRRQPRERPREPTHAGHAEHWRISNFEWQKPLDRFQSSTSTQVYSSHVDSISASVDLGHSLIGPGLRRNTWMFSRFTNCK